MGDMVDNSTEQGEEMWYAHLISRCSEDCTYCKENEESKGDFDEYIYKMQ